MTAPRYALIPPSTPEDWAAYHELRRKILFEDRGLCGKYDANHPDDQAPDNHPLLLTCEKAPVAAMRIDIVIKSTFAIMRTVAVTTNSQRQGHGRILLSLAEAYALKNASTAAVVFASPDAIGFYTKCGYEPYTWDPDGSFGSGSQMRKLLTSRSTEPLSSREFNRS